MFIKAKLYIVTFIVLSACMVGLTYGLPHMDEALNATVDYLNQSPLKEAFPGFKLRNVNIDISSIDLSNEIIRFQVFLSLGMVLVAILYPFLSCVVPRQKESEEPDDIVLTESVQQKESEQSEEPKEDIALTKSVQQEEPKQPEKPKKEETKRPKKSKEKQVKAPDVPPPPPPKQVDPEAIYILSIFQKKGRLIDFLQEDITSYDDEQVGQAVRAIHAGCKEVLDEYLKIEPVINNTEGEDVTVEAGFDPIAIRLTGNVSGTAPFTGILQHSGWRVNVTDIPKMPTNENATIIEPAEIELM